MPAPPPGPDEFARLALALDDEPTLLGTVEAVLDFARDAVGADYAGVMLKHRQRGVETIAATDPRVAELDALQLQAGEGPDLEVIEDRLGVLVTDTAQESRWPGWARMVHDAGIRSMLCVRIHTTQSTVGTLNLYARAADSFDEADQYVAHTLARHAAVAMKAQTTIDNLAKAADARKLIGMAQGIVMERYALDEDRAFSVMLRYSQDRNVKLRSVAQEILQTRDLPGEVSSDASEDTAG